MSRDAEHKSDGTSEADKAKARKWFTRAKAVADSRNYDYAIEAYIGGLRFWLDAVDEGHKPLRVVAMARKMAGKKPLGFLEARKYPTTGKDPRQNVLNAEFLWAHDPGNVAHMEAMVLNAAKAGCGEVGAWMGAICADALMGEKKVSPARFSGLCEALDTIGEAAQKASCYPLALEAYEILVKVAQLWQRQHAQSQEATRACADATGKLTIVKGRFDSSESFRDSLQDKQAQAELQDRDRVIQADERIEELTAKARAEYEADRTAMAKLKAYIDLLTRREREDDEIQAIEVLTEAFRQTKNYSLKVRADDLRIKQMTRRARSLVARLRAAPGDAQVKDEARRHRREQLEFEIAVFEERARQYPTDLRVRYGLAERCFKAKRFDEAIPYFQQAQADGRHRSQCRLYIGRCFFEKGLYVESTRFLKQALEGHESTGDETGKELHYWLARSLEASGQKSEAADVYGQIIQWDYNYRDARTRLEQLRRSGDPDEAKT